MVIVADPYRFQMNLDPDPDTGFMMNLDSGSGSRASIIKNIFPLLAVYQRVIICVVGANTEPDFDGVCLVGADSEPGVDGVYMYS
jgi:hypothetical protein